MIRLLCFKGTISDIQWEINSAASQLDGDNLHNVTLGVLLARQEQARWN